MLAGSGAAECVIVQEGFAERKFQHDIAGYIGDLEARRHELGGLTIVGEDFPDRRAGDLPSLIGIPQFDSLVVADDVSCELGVEKISGH